MPNLKYYQNIIKEKRKSTSFRDFLTEIVSWHPFVLNKNNDLISRFPKSDRVKVVSAKEFNENREKLIDLGNDYNFEMDFFENFKLLFNQTPLPNIFHYQENENSDYTDIAVDSKNTYLSNSVVLYSQNILYSFMVRGECNNVINSMYISSNSENIYFSRGVIQGYNIFYSSFINNSNNIWFSSNMTGCTECLKCNNLENQKYCINNKKLEKEEYFKQKKQILKDKYKFYEYFLEIETIGKNHSSTNVEGNSIVESENIENGHYVFNTKNGKNIMFIGAKSGNENFYDVFIAGGSGRYNNYGVQSTGGSDEIYCSAGIGYSFAIYYSYFLENCSFCIACIGIKNKSYCILNKQYTKQEWEILAEKIFVQMEKQGTLGDFFPGFLNPFYFNDTMAGLLGNFTKKEVEKQGFLWRNEEIKVDIPKNAEVILTVGNADLRSLQDLKNPKEGQKTLQNYQKHNKNGNWEINPDILNKVIVDKKGNYYKIVKMEYDFLLKHGLPLPETHWLDRMKINLGV